MRLRGLPYTATAKDILDFFEDVKPIPESIKIGVNNNNMNTGFAVVKFASKEDLLKAHKEYQGKNMNSRWIELYLIDKNSYDTFYDQYANFFVRLQNERKN